MLRLDDGASTFALFGLPLLIGVAGVLRLRTSGAVTASARRRARAGKSASLVNAAIGGPGLGTPPLSARWFWIR
jgi:hypothetical protein